VTWVSRERTEFKFQLATSNINPNSNGGVLGGHLAGKLCGLSGHKLSDFNSSRFGLTLAVLMLDIETHGR